MHDVIQDVLLCLQDRWTEHLASKWGHSPGQCRSSGSTLDRVARGLPFRPCSFRRGTRRRWWPWWWRRTHGAWAGARFPSSTRAPTWTTTRGPAPICPGPSARRSRGSSPPARNCSSTTAAAGRARSTPAPGSTATASHSSSRSISPRRPRWCSINLFVMDPNTRRHAMHKGLVEQPIKQVFTLYISVLSCSVRLWPCLLPKNFAK